LAKIYDKAQSVFKTTFYHSVRYVARMLGVLIFDLRCLGREHMEFDGPAIILCTHQSHFDPVLVGLSYNGRMNYLARRTLFNNKILGTIIYLLDAIELDRDRSGIAGLKEMLKRLKHGGKVLVFPEGTRSADGKIGPMRPGFLAVARRSKVPLVPIAVTGAYEALPRSSKVPWRYPIYTAVGPRIEPDEITDLSDDDVLHLISERLHQCYHRANALRRR
jgi:1-acyl-sn-glycerol-3-phosphate acyltransferase